MFAFLFPIATISSPTHHLRLRVIYAFRYSHSLIPSQARECKWCIIRALARHDERKRVTKTLAK
jgi:hypothetical protein